MLLMLDGAAQKKKKNEGGAGNVFRGSDMWEERD